MADNYLITGYHGKPHVTAENDRGIHAGIFGAGRFVLPVGKQFNAEYIGNNTIRMYDGKLLDNGAAAGIPAGDYIDLSISNASQGMKRHDLIVFQYSKDASSLVETGSFIVVQGAETSGTPADPALEQADLLSGYASIDHMPLWRVVVSGTAIAAPVQVFALANNLDGMLKESELADWAKAAKKPSYTADEISGLASWAKASTKPTYTADEIVNFPAWAKASTKPSYTADEISGLADYVVAQGVTEATYTGDFAENAISDSWIYRKWNSGLAECWIRLKRSAQFNSSFGGLYESHPFPMAEYPFSFFEMPREFATGGDNSSGCWVEVSGQAQQTLTNTNSYQLIRPVKSTTNETLTINLYVVGKWK